MANSGDGDTPCSTAYCFLLLFFLIEQIVCCEFICRCCLQIIHRSSDGSKYLPAKLNVRKQQGLAHRHVCIIQYRNYTSHLNKENVWSRNKIIQAKIKCLGISSNGKGQERCLDAATVAPVWLTPLTPELTSWTRRFP